MAWVAHQQRNGDCAMTYQASLTLVSRNAKTGPIPVSTTTKATCPNDCPFKEAGCYAKGGPLAIFWGKVTSGEFGTSWQEFTKKVAKLPKGILWRHNQAGDLPGNGDSIDVDALASLVKANKGKRGFTYTHYDVVDNASNAIAVYVANNAGFTVNLSANTLSHADKLASLNIAPVVVVLPVEFERQSKGKEYTESLTDYRVRTNGAKLQTPQGRKVTICPATYRDDVTCMSCGLCARLRDVIVGFPAHGAQKKKASAIADSVASATA